MITITQKGDFSKLHNYFEKLKRPFNLSKLDGYGRLGVQALANATPKDTGKTASSWNYKINDDNNVVSISFYNTNIQNGINIAIILQYGHGTRNGGYVQGIDYVNPALKPIFDEIAEEAWKEVTRA